MKIIGSFLGNLMLVAVSVALGYLSCSVFENRSPVYLIDTVLVDTLSWKIDSLEEIVRDKTFTIDSISKTIDSVYIEQNKSKESYEKVLNDIRNSDFTVDSLSGILNWKLERLEI